MSVRREKVALALDDSFTGRIQPTAQAALDMHRKFTLAEATWEPHDWSADS